jgi:serine/threonine protein kinase
MTVVHGAENGSVPSGTSVYSGFPEPLAGKYQYVEYLGQGGIARVYRALRSVDGSVVAVKIPIVPDEQTGTHFMREIRFWERLHHPNILAIHAANILPVPYVEMEYAPRSLADCPLPLSPEGAVRVVRGIAAGLSFAHAAGVIHRDIKPENILCAEDGTPKITDWGLGTVTDGDRRTQVGGFSPGYAAPEQLRPSVYGTEDERTDLYQLGVLFFELLTGAPPVAGAGTGEMTLAVLSEPAPCPSESGAQTDLFDALILRCLEKEKEKRFSSVKEFSEALRQATGDQIPPETG